VSGVECAALMISTFVCLHPAVGSALLRPFRRSRTSLLPWASSS
jgi:hypothetical protein